MTDMDKTNRYAVRCIVLISPKLACRTNIRIEEQRNDIEGCSQGLKSSRSSSVIRHPKTIVMAEKYTLNLAAFCRDSE